MGQERRHRHEGPAAVAAGGARLTVLDHRRGQLLGRLADPVEGGVGQAGAVVPADPGEQDGADDVLGLVGGGLHRHRGQARGDAERLAQDLTFQTLAEGQVEAAPLDGVEQQRGRPGDPLQLVGRPRSRFDQLGRQGRRGSGVAGRHGEHTAEEEGPAGSRPVALDRPRHRLPDDRHRPLGVSGDRQGEVVEGVAVLLEDPVQRHRPRRSWRPHDGRA